jgi:diguanylate cyclase (GGDEF)-like protein
MNDAETGGYCVRRHVLSPGDGTVVTVTIPDNTKSRRLPMNMFGKLRMLFLGGGVNNEEFVALYPSIDRENRVLLEVFSRLAGIMFFLLSIVSTLPSGFVTVNSSTYLICGFVMLAIMLCERFIAPKHHAFATALVYVFEIVLYVFSIRISMLHADKPAVSAVAFLLVTPLLFYDRPVRLIALIATDVAAFCALAICTKRPEIAETDVWNMVTFGIVAAATTLFIMSIKIRALAQSRQIEYISQTDLLTGLKNRNHYENQLPNYPAMYTRNLICVYGDVNGLHEMNNRYGHTAGDRMLREVAAAMQAYFGPEHTYRIGGDEFAAFRMDTHPENVSAELERMGRELAAKGYYVSFGIAERVKEQGAFSMSELIREAEIGMCAAKREFYRQPEHNRRNRSSSSTPS